MGKAVAVFAQGAARSAVLTLYTADDFHIDEVRRKAKATPNFMNPQERKLTDRNSNSSAMI